MQLKETIIIRGSIEVLTGLHIGGGKDNIEIGGLDLPVIKNPRNEQPYIPGSSLKGKMRFLTEWAIPGKVAASNGAVHSCDLRECPVCRTFGTTKVVVGRGPTRLIVRDATLADPDKFDPVKYLEVKYENTINRMTGTAKNPRPLERVTPGTLFAFEMSYRIFDIDDDGGVLDRKQFVQFLHALKMLEGDTLGGSGSRGSGKVAFREITVAGSGFDETTFAGVDELIAFAEKGAS